MLFKNVLVVYNPKSGRFTFQKLSLVQNFFEKKNIGFTALNILENNNIDKTTTAPFDAVFAAGGDGTLNDIINRLVFSDIPIAHIPMGTVNLFALENKTPFFLKKALETILDTYRPVKVNIGKINDKFFLSMTGIGFDAYVVKNVEEANGKSPFNQAINNHIKYLGYIKKIIKASKNYEFPEIQMTISDGDFNLKQPPNANQIIAANLKYYGGPFKLFPENSCFNEDFGIRTLNNIKGGKNVISLIIKSIIKSTIFKKSYQKDLEHNFKAKKISVSAVDPDQNKNIYYQCDGEFAGSLPAYIEKVAGAVTLLVAPSLQKSP